MDLEEGIETVIDNLTPAQEEALISKLRKNGFQLDGSHILPKVIKKGRPSSIRMLLPVGYLRDGKAKLVNMDFDFLTNYHNQLREIYNSI